MPEFEEASRIFQGYRAIGYISNHVPAIIRYHNKLDDLRIVTSIGKTFNTYSSKLSLLETSHELPEDIICMDSDSRHVYTAAGNNIYSWKNGHKHLVHTYQGHECKIISILAFGPHIVSVDEGSQLIMHEVQTENVSLRLPFDASAFQITVLMHPSTYTNKILLGSKQGSMKLLNLKTQSIIYEFNGWGSEVTVIEQSPAVDVVGIGLSNGEIVIHNLKMDETLMKLQQEWGGIRCLSFRTDGPAHLVSTGDVGHIAVWDLQKKRVATQMRDVHDTAIEGCTFLLSEPLLVTNSSDNSLKVWLFNEFDETARQLHSREGHHLPVSFISFDDESGNSILSAGDDGSLRSLSTLSQRLDKNLGTASFNRKLVKKVGVRRDPNKMPPVTQFCVVSTRGDDWDDVVCLHESSSFVTTWSTKRSCMGRHHLVPDRIKDRRDVTATCVSITPCGHFCVVGYSDGLVDRFNLQSGIHRQTYGDSTVSKVMGNTKNEAKGHDGRVAGVTTDGLNQLVISAGSDGFVKVWYFKNGIVLSEMQLESPVTRLVHDKNSSLVAFALENHRIKIIDIHSRQVARIFPSHESDITDMTFSPDGKWLVASSTDGCIRVWDMIKSRLIDYFQMPIPCKSLSFSPNHEFLATSHFDTLGVYLWSNKTLFKSVSLKPLDSSYRPKTLTFPRVVRDVKQTRNEDEEGAQEEEEDSDDDNLEGRRKKGGDEMDVEYSSPEQISEKLITLSLQPSSRWKNLYNIDLIKKRNKPKDPPKIPDSAPFFLPTIAGLEPVFDIKGDNKDTSSPGKSGALDTTSNTQSKEMSSIMMSPFAELLLESGSKGDFTSILNLLKEMGPSKIDAELRILDIPLTVNDEDEGKSQDKPLLLLYFLLAVEQGLKSRKDYELVISFLSLFLRIHMDILMKETFLQEACQRVDKVLQESWTGIEVSFNENLAIINFLRSFVA